MQDNKTEKENFARFLINTAHGNSSSKDAAKAFLSAEGLNVEKATAEAMKKIRKVQTLANANKTAAEMSIAARVKQRAEQWVDNLLNSIDFSLSELVKQEHLTMSFRNVESLTQDDIRNILIKHFTLKFMDDQNTTEK